MPRRAATLLLSLTCGVAAAQNVSLNGSLGNKAALLLVDGHPHTVPVGQSAGGVKLLALAEDQATVEVAGQRRTLVLGASPGRLAAGAAHAGSSRQIVLASGPGGHYIASGSINGQSAQFLVDTGATNVSISQSEAERMGLPYREGRRVMTQTANGTVPAHLLQLALLRIGDVEVRGVDAIVVPAQMSHVLLGNSFLSRFQMRRDNDILTLELRY